MFVQEAELLEIPSCALLMDARAARSESDAMRRRCAAQFVGRSSCLGPPGRKDTLLRPRPKRVTSRLWSALLGEMNSAKYTSPVSACQFMMPQLAGAAAAMPRGLRGTASRPWGRTTATLARGGQPRRPMRLTRRAAWRGTTSPSDGPAAVIGRH
jgi:hypothetical protein